MCKNLDSREHRNYESDRRLLVDEAVVGNSKALDNIILFTAGGGLLIASEAVAGSNGRRITLAIALLISSLIFHAISYQLSIARGKRNVKSMDQWCDEDHLHGALKIETSKELWGRSYLDNLSMLAALLGAILLSVSILFD